MSRLKILTDMEYLVLGLALLMVGLLINEKHHFTRFFITELAVAIVIAVLIGIFIEEKHIADVKNNALSSLFGWNIPREYADLIYKQVLNHNFIRPRLKIKYSFKNLPDNIPTSPCTDQQPSYMTLKTEFYNEVTNIRCCTSEYSVSMFMDQDLFGSKNYFHSAMIVNNNDISSFTKSELAAKTTKDSVVPERFQCEIGTYKIEPDKSLSTRIVTLTTRPIHYNCETFETRYYTESVEIILKCDPGKFLACCTSTSAGRMIEYKGKDFYHWRNEIPFLPTQGITLYWRAVGDSSDQETPAEDSTGQFGATSSPNSQPS